MLIVVVASFAGMVVIGMEDSDKWTTETRRDLVHGVLGN